MTLLDAVDAFGQRGAFLDAWTALTALPADERAKSRARMLEARLLDHLGAPRRARRLVVRHHKEHPSDPHARIGIAFARLEERGPFDTWKWLRENPIAPADDLALADALEVETVTLIALRDFEAARSVLDRWREAGVRESARAMCESQLLAVQDRVADALACARSALDETPSYRRLVMMVASLLVQLGRAGEAVAMLRHEVATMQSRYLAELAFTIALGVDDHEAAAQAVESLPPLLQYAEPAIVARAARMRAEAAYRRGDIMRARALLAECRDGNDELLEKLATRLAKSTPRDRRVVLDVPFVRQEHFGCAPATLASLAGWFGRPADHVEVADRICYHGTPAHAERSWAEEHGFVTREMRLTWDVAVALVDRGIPFGVSTFVPGMGHAQALMGFDERRRSFILRDPSVPLPVEVDAESFLHDFRHTGPRCLIVVPTERADALDGIDLPDTRFYDGLYEVERALAVHDRPRALAAADALQELAADHHVSNAGRRAIAAYDASAPALKAVAEAALAADADNRLARLDLLTVNLELAPRALRLDALEQAKGAGPIFAELLAAELLPDTREHARAKRLLHRALRKNPSSGRAIQLLGEIAWREGDVAFATSAMRFAACLEPTVDQRVRTYAALAQRAGRKDEALGFARACFDRLGARSAAPALLLADMLEDSGDSSEAARVLEAACTRRADDGLLLLARAHRAAAAGPAHIDEARSLLESARGRVDELTWTRSAAIMTGIEGRVEAVQLEAWRKVAEAAPLTDAPTHVAMLLRRTQGPAAAASYLGSCVERFPHHRPTVRAHLEALRDATGSEREKAIASFLEMEPSDAWAQRELALVLAEKGRHDDATAALERAAALDPRSAALHLTRAFIARERGDIAGVRAATLAAIESEPDSPMAIVRHIEHADPAERPALLENLYARLGERAFDGDTFAALHASSVPYVSQEWISDKFGKLRAARPDVPMLWVIGIRDAIATCPPAAAVDLAANALARFPLVPEIHLEAAEAFSIAGDADRAIQHLERTVELGPHLNRAVARLANALEARGDHARADLVLEDARKRARFDTTIALEAVRIRIRRGEMQQAIDTLEAVLSREPDLESAWSLLGDLWAAGSRERALEVGARFANAHPMSARTQASFAFMLIEEGRASEALSLVDAATRREVRSTELRDAKACALALLGRHEDALAVCRPAPSEIIPPEIGARAAWIQRHRGDLDGAIRTLQGVLHADPSFVGGWQRLVEWWLEATNAPAAVDAATRLVALAPMASSSHVNLGRALLASGDKSGAATAFRRAIERDPSATFAATQLFRLAADARNREDADIAVAVIRRRAEEHERVAFEVEHALLEGNSAAATELFTQACLDPKVPRSALAGAMDALLRAFGRDAERVLDDAVRKPDATEVAGAIWMATGIARHGLHMVARVRALDSRSQVGRGAAIELFDKLMEDGTQGRVASTFRDLRDWLARDDTTWSAPFRALLEYRLFYRAVWWGRSWKRRSEAPRTRLHGLALAFHAVGLRRRGMELTRASAPESQDGSSHSWIAFDAAVEGRLEEAAEALARADSGELWVVDTYPRALARHLIAISRAPAEERKALYAERNATIEEILAKGRAFSVLNDTLGRARARLVRELHDPRAWFAGTKLSTPGTRPFFVLIALATLARSVSSKDVASVVLPIVGLVTGAWVAWRLWRAALARL